jgi:sortase A
VPELSEPPRRLPRRRRPARPVLAILVSLLLVTAALVTVLRTGQGGGEALAAPVQESTLEPAPPGTTTTTTITTMALAVPEVVPAPTQAPAAPSRTQPTPPPPDERAASRIVKVGEIRIPKIGLVHPVYEGVTLTVVDHGPGHWPGSAMPGQLGNSVFAGHRVTHSHPFRNLDQLAPGDEILFTTDAGTFTYRMTKQEIVKPTDTWIVNPTPNATLTLFACHPPGSARERIVVRADFVPVAPA